MTGSVVEVTRGEHVESVHRISIAVAGAEGQLLAFSGDAQLSVFARSAIKPFQALPLVTDGVLERFGWGDAELALACASHSGEARHVELAAAMLAGLGLAEDALACGPHMPFNEAAARELRGSGRAPSRLHNNCSGKHAGMLALAAAHGWPLDGYHEASHPVQQRMLAELSRWSGVPPGNIPAGVDGCGVATFALPLQALAATFGRLAAAAAQQGSAESRVVQAMMRHPDLVGGTGRLCTELMRASPGRIFAKVGAEGVYCAGSPETGIGVALKVEDGALRAAEPALIATLRLLGLIDAEEMRTVQSFAEPAVRNTRGEVVGMVRARVTLEDVNG